LADGCWSLAVSFGHCGQPNLALNLRRRQPVPVTENMFARHPACRNVRDTQWAEALFNGGFLQRIESLETWCGSSLRDLSGNAELPKSRTLRFDESNPAGRRIGPSNIAEGKGRSSDREFALFLRHARGSLLELETQLLIAGELGYLTRERADSLAAQTEQLAKTLNALLNVVKDDSSSRKDKKRQPAGPSEATS
jgi:hypothetical protein